MAKRKRKLTRWERSVINNRPGDRSPLVVSYGMGVDSTAMLVGMQQRGMRPDLILFADTGSEKPETYAYLEHINAWLDSVQFPRVTVVKNHSPKAGYRSLEEQLLTLRVLPPLAYRKHQCSLVWKRDPQHRFIKEEFPQARNAWARGQTVITCIGYDAGAQDRDRATKSLGKESPGFTNRFLLQDWRWDRDRCKAEIAAAGLPLPVKSACFFCPAMKKDEVTALHAKHPQLAARSLEIERLAQQRGLKTIKGLGIQWTWQRHLNFQLTSAAG
jgi:hypothetical protein